GDVRTQQIRRRSADRGDALRFGTIPDAPAFPELFPVGKNATAHRQPALELGALWYVRYQDVQDHDRRWQQPRVQEGMRATGPTRACRRPPLQEQRRSSK